MQKIADEELEKQLEHQPAPRTARTTIPQAVLSKFGKEFSIPKSNDYNVLKKYLKDKLRIIVTQTTSLLQLEL